MFEYIQGKIAELTPAYVVVDNSGIGYFINISLNTYSKLSAKNEGKIFIHQVVREDSNALYGFIDKKEREMFLQLVSVSGVGANTARMMLSSLSSTEIQKAILNGDVNTLKGVKGIGVKSAQRIIVDLKDKVGKIEDEGEFFITQDNTIREEALSALVMLGFVKKAVEKVLDKILSETTDMTVEDVVKQALKRL